MNFSESDTIIQVLMEAERKHKRRYVASDLFSKGHAVVCIWPGGLKTQEYHITLNTCHSHASISVLSIPRRFIYNAELRYLSQLLGYNHRGITAPHQYKD